MKVIALDCDGVINSNILIRKWMADKYSEIEKKQNTFSYNEIREEVRNEFQKEFCHCEELVFPELAKIISTICEKTDAKILWSSTWRTLDRYKNIEDAKKMFNRRGLPGDVLIGYTPKLGADFFTSSYSRGSEIRMWLFNNVYGNIEKCAVIDDREDAGHDLPTNAKFFQTDENVGITDLMSYEICDYLNE